jgi:RNA-directed DNA polymerase
MNPSSMNALARVFLAGEPSAEKILERANYFFGREWRWMRPLAKRYVRKFSSGPRPRQRDVFNFLAADRDFAAARLKHADSLTVAHWVGEQSAMWPANLASDWGLPGITTTGGLAAWAGLTVGDLEWLADLKAFGRRNENHRLRHYHYRITAKRSGEFRLIEAPKLRLKLVQRKILAELLDKIPPHNAAHGFVRGRSIRSFAAPHSGRRVVLRMDVRDFFPSIGSARVQALFRMLGYPEPVADLLGGLCTTITPRSIWPHGANAAERERMIQLQRFYDRPHLPQGAPTSPALGNICFFRADSRLAGLAKSAGATYTRYADDLAFSGSVLFERSVDRFATHAAAILLEEGFAPNFRKTRVMRKGVRQRLAGLSINTKPNVIRADYDRLKATLTNCARHGSASQNRDRRSDFRAHLRGRIAFVASVNAEKGSKLLAIFNRIVW